jgi:Fe-S-cluster containining protein
MSTPEDYAKYLPDCVKCGACCHANFSWDAEYASMSAADLELAKKEWPAEKVKELKECADGASIPTTCYNKGSKSKCGCAMLDQRDHKRCTVYAHRPTVCREFTRGGPECIREYLAFHRCLGRDV